MRIRRLDLIAFGPHAGLSLDFAPAEGAAQGGLHVIHGDNEAGKSSTLRAIQGLLFGIQERTTDAWSHDMPSLRIGALVEDDDGDAFEVIRRKGRKKTLREPDDKIEADETRFAALLRGVSEAAFEQVFGLDHTALRAGGADLVDGDGELGRALFGAGVGTAGFRRAQESIDAELSALYARNATKPKLNNLFSRLKAAEKQLRDCTLAVKTWTDARAALDAAESKRGAAKGAADTAKLELSRLERLTRTVPLASVIRDLETQLEAFADLPSCPDDLPAQRATLDGAIDGLTRQRGLQTGQIEKLRGRVEEFTVDAAGAALLEREGRITELFTQLGSYRAAVAELRAAGAAVELPADADSVRADLVALRALAAKYDERAGAAARATEDAEAKAAELREFEQDFDAGGEAPDFGALERAVQDARGDVKVAQSLRDADKDPRPRAKRLASDVARFDLWTGDADALRTAKLPALARVREMRKSMEDAAKRVAETEARQRTARDAGAQATRELDGLQGADAVPSESDLESGREARDAKWRAVRARWLEGAGAEALGGCADDGELAEELESAVEAADTVADRLRREADRVQQRARLEADARAAAAAQEAAGLELESQRAELADLERVWMSWWKGLPVEAAPPAAMEDWVQSAEALQTRLHDVDAECAKWAADAARCAEHRSSVVAALEAIGHGEVADENSTFDTLLDAAQQVVDRLQRARPARDAFADAEQRRKRAAEELAAWQREWAELTARVGIEATRSPQAAEADFERLDEALAREADRRRVAKFEADVARLELGAGADAKRSADAVVEELHRGVVAAARARDQLPGAQRDLEDAQVQLEEIEAGLAAKREERARLLAPFGAEAEDAEALVQIEARVRERAERNAELAAARGKLLVADGRGDFEQARTEAAAVDPDALAAERAQAAAAAKQADEDYARAIEAERDAVNAFEQLDGAGQAAEAAAEVEALNAEIEVEAQRYRVLATAKQLLVRAVDRYRRENQGPVLSRARELFSRLTLGAYTDLETDLGEDGKPRLLAVRATGGRATHEQMSDGTRDQLFLALKVATLETLIEREAVPRLPVVLDDVLVHFDDARTAAALDVFADLAKTTQVILFTHHQSVADLAHPHATTFAHI